MSGNASLPLAFLEQQAADWLEDSRLRRLSPATINGQRFATSKLLRFLRERGVGECGARELRAFLAAQSTLRPGTAHTYYSRLRTFFRWVVEYGGLEASPLDGVRAPRVPKDQVQPFSEEQVRALFAAAGRGRQARRDTAILSFLLDTGARASEACSLTVGDLDLSGRRATVLGKGGKRRVLFLGRETARDLYFYLRTRATVDTSPVFASERGTSARESLTRHGLLQLFGRLGRAAGLKGVRCSPHTARHTFAVQFLRGGGSEFALREMLGHESLTMTARYVALARADVAAQHRAASPVDALRRRR